MKKLMFMSPEHVAICNVVVNASEEVRAACARLPRDITVSYRLRDEDGGPDVWWRNVYSRADGCVLSLGPSDGPVDHSLEAGYWAMIEQSAASIRGGVPAEEVAAGVAALTGEAAAGEAHKQAWLVGLSIDVDFPERGRDKPIR